MRGNASAAARKGAAAALAASAAAILAVTCLLAAAGLASAAQPSLDLSKTSSLKVTANVEDAPAVIGYDGIQVDAYLVARAVQTPGFDTYAYEPVAGGPFASLGVAALNDAMASKDSAKAAEASRAFAQEALAAALDDLRAPAPTLAGAPSTSMSADAGAGFTCSASFPSLQSGLYLLVAHGAGLSAADYAKSLPDGKTATVAYSALTEYAFDPVLVSLPTRDARAGETLGTASGTSWVYDVSAMLKPQASPRMGSLEIVKGVDRYQDGQPVTFVFSVQATGPRGDKVYDDVVSVTFAGPGSKSILIEDKIPAGSTVTVREVYSGAAYQVVGPAEGTAEITAAQVAQVSFANTSTNTKVHGGSVTNSFAYGEGGWELTPAYSHDAAASED